MSFDGILPGDWKTRVTVGDAYSRVFNFFDGDGVEIDASGWTLSGQFRTTGNGTLLAELVWDQTGLETHQWRGTLTAVVTADIPEGVWWASVKRTAGGASVKTLLAGVVSAKLTATA